MVKMARKHRGRRYVQNACMKEDKTTQKGGKRYGIKKVCRKRASSAQIITGSEVGWVVVQALLGVRPFAASGAEQKKPNSFRRS